MSQASPKRRPSRPNPPPSVRPAAPVIEYVPAVVASPKAAHSWSSRPSREPASRYARRFRGIDAHALHLLQVDHQPAVAGGLARDAVPAGPHGRQEPVFAREVDGVAHVARAGAAGDQRGLPVEHAVPDATAGIVGGASLQEQVAAQARREILDRRTGQVEVAAVERFRGDVADVLEHRGPAGERPGRGQRQSRAHEFASFHVGFPPARTVLPAWNLRTQARIAKPTTRTSATSRTACKDAVVTMATQAASASTAMMVPPGIWQRSGAIAPAQRDQRCGRGAMGQHARDHEDREQVLERAGDGKQPGEQGVDDDGDVRRAIDGVHRQELPRQVAGLGEGIDISRRDQQLHDVAAEAGQDGRSGHQGGARRPQESLREVGERQLRGGRIWQHAKAGEHQQDVQQAAEREAGQDADRQIAPGIAHLAGEDRRDVEAEAGEQRKLKRVREAVRRPRLRNRQVVPAREPETGEGDRHERQELRDGDDSFPTRRPA